MSASNRVAQSTPAASSTVSAAARPERDVWPRTCSGRASKGAVTLASRRAMAASTRPWVATRVSWHASAALWSSERELKPGERGVDTSRDACDARREPSTSSSVACIAAVCRRRREQRASDEPHSCVCRRQAKADSRESIGSSSRPLLWTRLAPRGPSAAAGVELPACGCALVCLTSNASPRIRAAAPTTTERKARVKSDLDRASCRLSASRRRRATAREMAPDGSASAVRAEEEV
mmetsp:Transcript_24840/g.80211  ORF Transcript_24840/g.80211 Transcript_24840/m.80211 type:complete len:236 (+) Transcript_24840:534-1241(+)